MERKGDCGLDEGTLDSVIVVSSCVGYLGSYLKSFGGLWVAQVAQDDRVHLISGDNGGVDDNLGRSGYAAGCLAV